MGTAGVVCDDWKAPIFRRHLTEAKFKFTEISGQIPGTTTFRVEYEWVHQLQPIVEAANKECRLTRPPGKSKVRC